MKKTFCDRHPEVECTTRAARLFLTVDHLTGGGEVAGMDDYRPADLCGDCVDELTAMFGLVVRDNENIGPDSAESTLAGRPEWMTG